jgi:hypothetical protein
MPEGAPFQNSASAFLARVNLTIGDGEIAYDAEAYIDHDRVATRAALCRRVPGRLARRPSFQHDIEVGG